MVIAHRYRLEKPLGRSGMGVVWEALDTSLDRKVAVKGLLYPGMAPVTRAQWVSRARREAQAIARIEHRNVVAVHDVIEDGEQVWIVMELLNSRSLADLLSEQQQLTVPHTARIGLQVLRGLKAVHEAGVVHRDVKPHNILFRPDGRALLMDFGIATFEGAVQVTRTHELIGTAQYLAPELLGPAPDGSRAATAASDLWTLGITLYEMVEGRRPFEGLTDLEVLVAVRESPVPPMKYAGPLSPLIEALLRKDPARRPDAAEAEQLLQAVTLDSLALDTAVGPGPGPGPVPGHAAGAGAGAGAGTAARTAGAGAGATAGDPPGPGSGRTPGAGRREEGARRRGDRWKVPVAVVCTALLAGGAWLVWGRPDTSGGKGGEASDAAGGGERYRDTDDTLQIGVKTDQPGLSVRLGTTDKYRGFEPDLAKAIGTRMGYPEKNIEFVPVTTGDRDDQLITGQVDLVIATYSIDEKRNKDEEVDFVGPYYTPMMALLVKNQRYKDLDDLQDSPTSEVCTARNSTYDGDWFKKYRLTPKKNLPGTYEKCISALEDRRTRMDAVATDDVIAEGYAHSHPGWKTLRVSRDPEGYGVALKRSDDKSTRLLKRDVCRALSGVMAKPSTGKSQYETLYDRHLKPILGRSAPDAPDLTQCGGQR
ncbi:serine/threonine-protein kinase [Streptomyces sp. NHF165]|uniref:serine/threonine-protein kinase n=1 Tax=Streptomyces sp. NHF165 TaxID=2175864 RepID=UPI001F448369|nr:serine/threonine-protein kinase [Streptomyces sp. NHF165]